MWIKCGKSDTQSSVELAESRSPEHLKKQMTCIIKSLNNGSSICRIYSEDEEEH